MFGRVPWQDHGSEELESHGLDIKGLGQHTHSTFGGMIWLFSFLQGSGESQLIPANTAQTYQMENHLISIRHKEKKILFKYLVLNACSKFLEMYLYIHIDFKGFL